MTATTTGAVTGYRLVTPAVWDRVDLTSPTRTRTVQDLISRQFRGQDDQPVARTRATALLQAEVDRAHAIGGLELHLSARAVGGVVVPASVLVHVLPGRWDAHDLLGRFASGGASGRDDLTLVDLAAGRAVRRLRRSVVAGPGADPDLPVVALEHFVPVPTGGGDPVLLVVSGHTLGGPLEDAVVHLFDTVAATLRWNEATP